MATPAHITNSLKRLCELELDIGYLASGLGKSKKHVEIARLRSIIPASILGHHDRLIQRGKRSVVPVVNGVCSACHLRLPIGHAANLQSSQDLEVCDNCGAFIYLERSDDTSVPADLKPAKTKQKRRKVAAR